MASKPLHLLLLGLLATAPLATAPLVFAEGEMPLQPPLAPTPEPPPPVQSVPIRRASPSLVAAPLRPSPAERVNLAPRSFDASLEALEREGVILPGERVRVHRGLIAPLNPARREACNSGALSTMECGTGVVVRGRGRLDGIGFTTADTVAGLSDGGSPAGSGAASSRSFSTDALPLPPISVPVTALLSGAGGTFRLTDVFGRTPRPAAIAGNGNAGLLFPLIGSAVVSSPFGWRLHPVIGTWLLHAGRDLAAPQGTPVVAALDGRVVASGLAGGYGLAIEIEHDGPRRRTLYGHLSELYVKEGQRVRQGEVIGRVGSTGLSTGPHLHFEVRLPQEGGWVAVDPGDLAAGGSMIASLPGMPGLAAGQAPDAVAMLMGQLLQTLERPRHPLAPPAPATGGGLRRPGGTATPVGPAAPTQRQRG